MIRVKVRPLRGPIFHLEDLPATTTLSALHERIAASCDLPRAQLLLLTGYPPKPIEDDARRTLQEAAIRSGQLIIARSSQGVSPSSTGSTGASGSGRRSGSSGSPKRRRRRVGSSSSSRLMRSKEDIAERLVGASSGSEGRGWRVSDPIDRFLRHVQRLAVKKQYEIAEGNRRYAAALANDYEIRQIGASVNAAVKLCKVQFKFGQRTYHEDEFQLLNDDLLRATLQQILGLGLEETDTQQDGGIQEEKSEGLSEEEMIQRRERLRPFFIAEVSPQLFWSLVKNHGTDFKRAFRTLLPEVSWDFLDTRYRRISAKAKEAKENEAYAEEVRASKRRKRKTTQQPDTVENLSLPSDLRSKFKDGNLLKACLLSEDEISKLGKKHGKEAVDEWVESAKVFAAKAFVDVIMPQEKCREAAKSVLEVQTVYDVMRLKVPGRIKLLAEESGEDEALFASAQKAAEALVEKYQFLEDYRTRG